MILLSLELQGFRNFTSLSLPLDSRGAVLEAPNGRGKTNFLEAIHYLSLFRSFRGAPDSEVASFGTRSFVLHGELTREGDRRTGIGVAVDGAKKRLAVDGRAGRPAEHVGTALSVVLCPEDIRLVQGSPGRRRRYLDVVLALSSARYFHALQEYRRVLRHRNSVLQSGTQADVALLEPWTEGLLRHGAVILRERLRFLTRWGPRFAEISAQLAGTSAGALSWRYESSSLPAGEAVEASLRQVVSVEQPVSIGQAEASGMLALPDQDGGPASYQPAARRPSADFPDAPGLDDVTAALRAELERRAWLERRRGVTLVGPHRDDLSFHSLEPSGAERDLRKFGSQGEQRTAALSLRFLELEVLSHERGELPVVLLDDVFSELDPRRSRELLGFLAPGQQVFLTTPKPLALDTSLDLPRYTIAEGAVRAA